MKTRRVLGLVIALAGLANVCVVINLTDLSTVPDMHIAQDISIILYIVMAFNHLVGMVMKQRGEISAAGTVMFFMTAICIAIIDSNLAVPSINLISLPVVLIGWPLTCVFDLIYISQERIRREFDEKEEDEYRR
jgi:hypothetical protein